MPEDTPRITGERGSSQPTEVVQAGEVAEALEGGHVTALEEYSFVEAKHRAETARMLAYTLVLMLGLTVAGHYAAVFWLKLSGKADAIEDLSRIFTGWLPVISGLVGSAITYYFTREKG